jgi:hypothetical protein
MSGRHVVQNKTHEAIAVAIIDASTGIDKFGVLVVGLHKTVDDGLSL